MKLGSSQVQRTFWLFGIVWSVLVALLIGIEVKDRIRTGEDLARQEVEAQFNWLVIFRGWVASHGGVYVPQTEHTRPNQYLQVPEREITTPSGKKLTLMNPAYVTRQIYEDYFSRQGVLGRLTSLKPINPKNAPDDWERGALEGFEAGEMEKFEFRAMNGKTYLRLIRPLMVEQPCMYCHAAQGYHVGEVRGGLSLSVPVETYLENARSGAVNTVIGLCVLWLIGITGLYGGARQLLRNLRDREEMEKNLADAQRIANIGSWELSAATGTIRYSEMMGNIYYLEPGSRLTLNYLVGMCHPDDRARYGKAFDDAIHGKGRFSVQHRIMLGGGGEKVIQTTGEASLAKEGVKVIGTAQDITEKIRIEEERGRMEGESHRLATAIKRAGEGVLITDAEGNIEYINPALENLTGYRLEEVQGKTPRVFKSGQHDQRYYEDLWHTIKSGNVWRGRIINKKRDGTVFEEDMSISPIADAKGTITHFVAVKRDVTREAMLARSQNYFTAITAHELRTPLTKLHLVEVLLKKLAEEEPGESAAAQDILVPLREATSSFARIVSATTMISDMARSGHEKPFIRNFIYYDLDEAVENARARLKDEGRAVALNADLSGLSKQAAVSGVRSMLQQVFDEVLSNAIKYTPDGKSVDITATLDAGSVCIEVRDEGAGIPEDKIHEVSMPYYSLENPLQHSTGRYKFHGGGIGLGLTVVKLLMEYHNGSLGIARRQDGSGMAVTLRFPLAPGDKALDV